MAIGDYLKSLSIQREAEKRAKMDQRVLDLLDKCTQNATFITKAEYDALFEGGRGLNSWEREALVPFMDDALLAHEVQYCLKNCSGKRRENDPCATYDEAVIHLYAPLLLARLTLLSAPR